MEKARMVKDSDQGELKEMEKGIREERKKTDKLVRIYKLEKDDQRKKNEKEKFRIDKREEKVRERR